MPSFGVAKTGILVTIETGIRDHGRCCDESPAAGGGSSATAGTASKRNLEGERVARSFGRFISPLESQRSRGRSGGT